MIRQTWTDKEPSEEREELLHTNIIITDLIVVIIVIVNANVIVILNVLIILTNTMHQCQIPGEI